MIRPRLTKERQRKIRRQNQLWIAAVLGIVMVFGLLIFVSSRMG